MLAALVRQNVMVRLRHQQMVIRQSWRIVAHHSRQPANQRCRQVIAWHWPGLVPQRAIEQTRSDRPAEVVPMAEVRSSYAGAVAERVRGGDCRGVLMNRTERQRTPASTAGNPGSDQAEMERLVEDLDGTLS